MRPIWHHLHDVISIPGTLDESLRKMACEIDKVINESISTCIRQLTVVLVDSQRRDDLEPIVVGQLHAVN